LASVRLRLPAYVPTLQKQQKKKCVPVLAVNEYKHKIIDFKPTSSCHVRAMSNIIIQTKKNKQNKYFAVAKITNSFHTKIKNYVLAAFIQK